MIDFTGDRLADPALVASTRPMITAQPGAVHGVRLWPYPERKLMRVGFEVDPGTDALSELQARPAVGRAAGLGNVVEPMDVVTALRQDALEAEPHGYGPAREPGDSARGTARHAGPVLPSWNASERRTRVAPGNWKTPWLKRLFVFGGGLALDAYGAWEMYNVVSVSRTTSLQYALLVLFTINFSWIALAFTSAVLGFFGVLFGAGRAARGGKL